MHILFPYGDIEEEKILKEKSKVDSLTEEKTVIPLCHTLVSNVNYLKIASEKSRLVSQCYAL